MAAILIVAVLGLAWYVLSQGQSSDLGFSDTDVTGALGLSDAQSKAVDLIKGFEGFSAYPYADPPGQTSTYSVGYGHQIRAGEDFSGGVDEATATQLLMDDISNAVDCVESSVQVDMNTNQEAALISFCYNVGCGAFQGSTLLKLLNQGDYSGASQQLSLWVNSSGSVNQGLVNRRQQEQGVFNG